MKILRYPIWTDLLHLFFPPHCRLCGRSLAKGEEHLCLHCLCDLPRTGYQELPDNPLLTSLRESYPFECGIAFYYFHHKGKVRQLIHSIKYKGHKEIAYWLGRHLARELAETRSEFSTFDYLVPVPLHPDKWQQRGFNQSEWIARGLQAIWGTPIDTTSLTRQQTNDSQTHKTTLQRWQNVCAIFKVSQETPLAGKRILLVDDVCTTGSTLLACAQALQALPDIRIGFLTLSCT